MRTPFGHSEPVSPEVAQAQAVARKRRRLLFGVVAALLLIAGYFVLAAFLPRWWARRVGEWAHDSYSHSLLLGLAFGFVCTFVPLLIAATVFYRRLNHQMRGAILLLAVVIAAPNLLTLSIALGSGSGAHAGDRIMDTQAPFFRGATLIGFLVGLVLFALLVWQYRAGRRVRALKRQAKANSSQPMPAEDVVGPELTGPYPADPPR